MYNAVYRQDGQPRDKVEIFLEPGVFSLDPSQPFDGRLVLGRKTILRSTLELVVDANGVPFVDANDAPIVLVEGARIDGSELLSTFFGMGIIEVGKQGLVEQLWVDGGDDPFAELTTGIEIVSQGTIKGVYSTGHFIGARVRAKGTQAKGTLDGNLLTGNAIGISVIGIEPTVDHPTGSDVEVKAALLHNTTIDNFLYNLNVTGCFGSDNNEVQVEAFGNIFRGGASTANVRIMSGTDFFSPGSNNCELKLKLADNLIADTDVGVEVSGGFLLILDPSIPLEERYSSNNEAKVNISSTTFENNSIDILVSGARSNTGEPAGGNNNEAKVVIQDGDPTALITEVYDCFPADETASCSSKAKVTFKNNGGD